MAQIFENALHLPKWYYAPIGEFIFRWAQLEYQLHEIIWRALALDNKTGRTLTVGMGPQTLTGILGTLKRQWLNEAMEKEVVDLIVKGVRDLKDFRNQLAHGSWQFPRDGRTNDVYMIYQRESAYRILPRAKKHRPAEIRKNVEKLRRLNNEAQKLIWHLDEKPMP